jgi:hypothetical protein
MVAPRRPRRPRSSSRRAGVRPAASRSSPLAHAACTRTRARSECARCHSHRCGALRSPRPAETARSPSPLGLALPRALSPLPPFFAPLRSSLRLPPASDMYSPLVSRPAPLINHTRSDREAHFLTLTREQRGKRARMRATACSVRGATQSGSGLLLSECIATVACVTSAEVGLGPSGGHTGARSLGTAQSGEVTPHTEDGLGRRLTERIPKLSVRVAQTDIEWTALRARPQSGLCSS